METTCKLTNDELTKTVIEWVRQLAASGGKLWMLSIPADMNKDPDMLICALVDRFRLLEKENQAIRHNTIREVIDSIQSTQESDDEKYFNEPRFSFNDILTILHEKIPPTEIKLVAQ